MRFCISVIAGLLMAQSTIASEGQLLVVIYVCNAEAVNTMLSRTCAGNADKAARAQRAVVAWRATYGDKAAISTRKCAKAAHPKEAKATDLDSAAEVAAKAWLREMSDRAKTSGASTCESSLQFLEGHKYKLDDQLGK
jgi:hypothetical protein